MRKSTAWKQQRHAARVQHKAAKQRARWNDYRKHRDDPATNDNVLVPDHRLWGFVPLLKVA